MFERAASRQQEMTLISRTAVGLALFCLGLAIGASEASAQGWWEEPNAPAVPNSWRGLGGSEIDGLRLLVEVEAVRRELKVAGSSEPVIYDAPFYPGLNIRMELMPFAWFRPGSALAPMQVGFVTGKHKVRTSALLASTDGSNEVKIPTRHDGTALGLSYPWRAESGLTVKPMAGWRAVEFALGGNPIYTSSYYEAFEFGTGLGFAPQGRPWRAQAEVLIRPSVDMGSTAAAFGSDESVWSWAAKAEAEYRISPQWLVRGSAGYDRYAGTFQIGESAASGKAELTDSFATFLVALGWAY